MHRWQCRKLRKEKNEFLFFPPSSFRVHTESAAIILRFFYHKTKSKTLRRWAESLIKELTTSNSYQLILFTYYPIPPQRGGRVGAGGGRSYHQTIDQLQTKVKVLNSIMGALIDSSPPKKRKISHKIYVCTGTIRENSILEARKKLIDRGRRNRQESSDRHQATVPTTTGPRGEFQHPQQPLPPLGWA